MGYYVTIFRYLCDRVDQQKYATSLAEMKRCLLEVWLG